MMNSSKEMISHQNKKSKAVKNWTITADKDIPDVDTETKSKKVEDQNKKFESKDNITYTTENTEQNNRKYSIGKNGINNRTENIGEIIEDKVPVETANIQTKTKQQDNDIVANKSSNYQQQKEATCNGQTKEKEEESK